MNTIRIQPPMIDVPEGKCCGGCKGNLMGISCLYFRDRIYTAWVEKIIHLVKCPACLAACAKAEKKEKE